jgi:hypothetical protein
LVLDRDFLFLSLAISMIHKVSIHETLPAITKGTRGRRDIGEKIGVDSTSNHCLIVNAVEFYGILTIPKQ